MGGSRVELFERIRRDHRREGLSIRGLADRHGVHRRTVRQALASALPPQRVRPDREAPVLDPARPLIDAMLREDLDAPRKQRHTARRVLARLVDEHDLDITYSTVRDYVRERRPQIAEQAGRAVDEVFVPQTHEPGAHAEVDFADVWVDLAGVRTKLALFTLRLSFSGRGGAPGLRDPGAGGVPGRSRRRVRAAGRGAGRARPLRQPQGRGQPGDVRSDAGGVGPLDGVPLPLRLRRVLLPARVDGAHEKGGVEGEGGRFRRTHLVPVPQVGSVAELNDRLAVFDERDDARRVGSRPQSVGHDFAVERPALRPLPDEAFETGIELSPRVDRHARISVRQCSYSVPARLIGARVRALLRAERLLVFDGRGRQVAEHPRATVRGSTTLVLDHYLEVLARKPGALRGATALAQARASGTFTAAHEQFWAAARAAHGEADGTRALVEVLLLHRRLGHDAVVAGLRAAVTAGLQQPGRRGARGPPRRQQRRGRRPGAAAAGPAGRDQPSATAGRRPATAVGGRLRRAARPPHRPHRRTPHQP